MGQKGQSFERDLCRKLSLWFSYGKDDDLFWRSSQSGGRATVRRRKGKSTRGHCGDIAATDSEGEPFVKCVTVEAKVGYHHANVFDLFDKPGRCGKVWFDWMKQAVAAARNAGTPYYCVVHLRNKKGDSRAPLIAFPNTFVLRLRELGCEFPTGLVLERACVFRLSDFFACVDPQDIKLILRNHCDKA